MEEHTLAILSQVVRGLGQLWPFLLISIPLAAAIDVVGVSKHVNRVVGCRPIIAIGLATLIGAFSPFCSCTSVAVMASLLLAGVPLAPVMSLWIASPSMDPEMFFLTVGMIGWELAVWRLVATLGMSFGAGLVTHYLIKSGRLDGTDILKPGVRKTQPAGAPSLPVVGVPAESLSTRFWRASWAATLLVGKFMAVALLLEAIITLYMPTEWVVGLLGGQSDWAVPAATLIGLPLYTSNLTALPMIAGLLERGMSGAAALAFLVAGPTTTLPAMACVWGIVKRHVFWLYLLIVLVVSIASGYLFMLF